MASSLVQLPQTPSLRAVRDGVDVSFVDELVARHGASPESLIPILQQIQEHYHYLPAPALAHLCAISAMTPASVTGVSTFYAQFRHRPAGKHIVRICRGTACHVKSVELVEEAIRRHLELFGDQDTDSAGQFTIERVGCLGCCTLAPVIQIDGVTYGHLAPDTGPQALVDFAAHPPSRNGDGNSDRLAIGRVDENGPQIRIGVGSCCVAGGSAQVRRARAIRPRVVAVRAEMKPVPEPLQETGVARLDGHAASCARKRRRPTGNPHHHQTRRLRGNVPPNPLG